MTAPAPRLLSVIAPCRNEAAFIDAFCDSVLRQQLPEGWHMEVLIADGESDDGTRERLQERCAHDARLVLVDNPGRIVSTGINACIARAQGEVVARLDIHTQFAPDYLARCIDTLERSGADNVGGPWVAQGTGAMGAAIAAAFQCRWVVGGARSRDQGLRGRGRHRVPGLLAARGVRALRPVRRGAGAEPGRRAQPAPAPGRRPHLAERHDPLGLPPARLAAPPLRPAAAVRLLAALRGAQARAAGLAAPARARAVRCRALRSAPCCLPWTPWPATALLTLYGAYLALASMAAARAAGAWHLLPRLPAVIAAFHLGYGWGTWQGLWDVLRKRPPAQRFARITR
jgi:succinoglycan biosynthesis protein ExoA